ncbi:MAG TPA: cytochrome o ubiquinol oxidase subunit IV [Candidatus Paceibacterota bacterium]|nr:cytochrome o ubiquinol oxidase subunit IV [Candidatus Paceibacterota bacterium]
MNRSHGSITSYTTGFIGSLVCTLLAYGLVVSHWATLPIAIGAIVLLAVAQLGIQLVLFLHLGRGGDSWNRAALVFAIIIVSIVVTGSLWIMYNLSARMMPSTAQMYQYMQNQSW